MQAKYHMTKLMKFSWTLKGSEIRSHYSNNFWDVSGQIDVWNKEIDLRKKNLLSWQNILNSRQIAADMEKKISQSRKSPL